jgi:hypothetical protein
LHHENLLGVVSPEFFEFEHGNKWEKETQKTSPLSEGRLVVWGDHLRTQPSFRRKEEKKEPGKRGILVHNRTHSSDRGFSVKYKLHAYDVPLYTGFTVHVVYNASTVKHHLSSLLWLLAVVVLSAVALSILDQWEERRVRRLEPEVISEATAMLVGYGGEAFPGIEGSGSLLRVGCGDFLIESKIPVVAPRLSSVLSALSTYTAPVGLHNPIFDKQIFFVGLRRIGRHYTVSFEGTPLLGGICDTPRLKAQIEETIRLYTDDFEIRLNGSVQAYECMGDESGLCGA